MMFEHKGLGAAEALLRTKSRKFYIKGWEGKAYEKECKWFNMYEGKQENLAEKVFFITGYLAGVELVWYGISSDWFPPPTHPHVFLIYFTIIL